MFSGRGAAENPPNRFEAIAYEPDPEAPDDERSAPRTIFLKDTSRTIIATNDSPDVPFEASINPYRGCEHGCSYCVAGDTPVLMADGMYRAIAELRVGDRIIGTVQRGRDRYYQSTFVLAHWSTTKVAFRLRLEDGTELVASGDHRFLSETGWKHVSAGQADRPSLGVGERLVGLGRSWEDKQLFECVAGASNALARSLERRLTLDLVGHPVRPSPGLSIVAIEPLNVPVAMFDITTGTGDFIANGVISHNCFARPTHEYLGMSAGLDFETRILVKEDAPELLRETLSSKRWEPKVVTISGVTDCYQPAERRFQLTRRCLEVMAEFRNPVAVITKNALVARDADVLGDLARDRAAAVFLSITSLDPELARTLEPRASAPRLRLEAIAELTKAGVPCGVMVAPVIPGINDHEIPPILEAAAKAGARTAGMVPLRLPYGVAELFAAWLERHRPGSKEKVLHQIRSLRDGRLNDPRFGSRMRGEGKLAEHLRSLFDVARRRAGLSERDAPLSTEAFRRPSGPQLELF